MEKHGSSDYWSGGWLLKVDFVASAGGGEHGTAFFRSLKPDNPDYFRIHRRGLFYKLGLREVVCNTEEDYRDRPAPLASLFQALGLSDGVALSLPADENQMMLGPVTKGIFLKLIGIYRAHTLSCEDDYNNLIKSLKSDLRISEASPKVTRAKHLIIIK